MKTNFLLFIFILFLAPTRADGEIIPLSVLNAQGDAALSCPQGRQMVRDVQGLYRRIGVHVSLREYRCRKNPWTRPLRLTEDSIGNVHWFYDEDWFIGRRFRGNRWLHHVILPPIIDEEGSRWLAGYAYQSCYGSSKRVATSNATMQSAENLPRYRHSVIAMAHEIGHLLGADHDDTLPASIMHSAAMHYVDRTEGWMRFSDRTISELRQCRVSFVGG